MSPLTNVWTDTTHLIPLFCAFFSLSSRALLNFLLLLPRQWRFPCGDMPYRCTSHDEYQQFVMGPQLRCPVYENSTSLLPPGQCVLSNNTCQFSSDAPTCATWISYCSLPYQCGTQEELDSLPTAQTNCPLMLDIPPPDMTCEPIDGQCQWYNPCRKWRQHCRYCMHALRLTIIYRYIFWRFWDYYHFAGIKFCYFHL